MTEIERMFNDGMVYGTFMMPTRYVIMMTNAVIKSSFLFKSLMTPPLDSDPSCVHFFIFHNLLFLFDFDFRNFRLLRHSRGRINFRIPGFPRPHHTRLGKCVTSFMTAPSFYMPFVILRNYKLSIN